MKITLKIWRQEHRGERGEMVEYVLDDVSEAMSFLDMLNRDLIRRGERVVAFDHDCREGICGQCSLHINGRAHGPRALTTACQLHMREFQDGDTVFIEPWRARAFPVLSDLVVDRSALDRIVEAGGFVSINAGTAPEANAIPIGKAAASHAFDAATCIGCGACVAACKNGSAMLFTAAKVSHLSMLPQGRVEAPERAARMVAQMDAEGFGSCSNIGACEAVCPKGISTQHIGRLNWEHLRGDLAGGA